MSKEISLSILGSYRCLLNGELIDPIFAYLTTLCVQTLEEG
jgi:hypothetical protein